MTISANYPTVAPSLDLDFANSRQLDPRVSFYRATTGTYYDGSTSAVAEQNLLFQSNTFSNNISWTNNSLGIVVPPTSSVSDPFGGTSAWTLTTTAGTNQHGIQNNQNTSGVAIVGTGTYSCYVQQNTAQYVTLASYNQFAVTVNLATGAVTQTILIGVNTASTVVTQIGSSTWYRISITFNTPVAGLAVLIGVSNIGTPSVPSVATQSWTSASGGESINIYGAQLEQKSGAGVYTATTTATITNYIPQLLTAPINQPRFDANPTTGASLGLLMEQQSTNLLTYSQDLSQAGGWTLGSTTVNLTSNIAPDGTLTANLMTSSATTNQMGISHSSITLTATSHTISVKVKYSGIQFIQIWAGGSAWGGYANFDLTGISCTASNSVLSTPTITAIGNGWYNLVVSFTATAASFSAWISFITTGTSARASSYTGNGTSGVYMWGAQLEALAFPTSYIPTVASQVTRAQDFVTMTGTNFSSWFNNQQGTVYCSFDVATIGSTNMSPWAIDNGTGYAYFLNKSTAGLFAFEGSNANYVSIGTIGSINSTQQSIYNYNNISGSLGYSGALNGGTVGTGSTPIPPSFLPTQVSLGRLPALSYNMTGHIRKFAYYPIATTSAQMQALTGS